MAFKLNVNNIAGNILRGRSVKSSVLSGLGASGLSGFSRSLVMSLMGGMEKANVHISNMDTGEKLSLAWTPEKISVSCSGKFQSYNVIERGEVKIPRGMNLASVKWSAKLPGDSRCSYRFVNSSYWQEPKEIIRILEKWREDRAKLRLLVTQTSINQDVYLDDFSYDWEGGHGDANYSIAFVSARDMQVKTVKEVDDERATKQAEEEAALESRPTTPSPENVIATAGASLWSIAQGNYGDGLKWLDIYDLNKGKIGGIADKIIPGVNLKLPL